MTENNFTEDRLVEQTAVELIKELWKDSGCHINAFGTEGEQRLGRERESDVLLNERLSKSLSRLNPNVPESVLAEAIQVISRERVSQTLDSSNYEIYKILLDGMNISSVNENSLDEDFNVRFLDFENPEKNDFL